MAKSFSAGVLLAFVAAASMSGCKTQETTAPSDHASTEASSTATVNESALEARAPDEDAQSVQKPPPEWTLELDGPIALQKRGRSAAYTYLDQALHMRLLYKPSAGGFGQGLTFHLPHVAIGQTGKVKASFAKLTLSSEGLRCSTRAEDAHFSVELSEFNRDVRVGSFEGRLLCQLDGEDEEPKYADVSGRFRHD